MQKYCQKSFNKFDIFGSKVGLIYKKDSLYRTAFGGFVTIVFVASLVLIFFNNVIIMTTLLLYQLLFLLQYSVLVQQIKVLLYLHITYTQYDHYQVTFVSSTSYDVNPEVIDIEKNKFMMAVKVDQTNFINRPTFMIGFERRHYYTLANGTYVQKKVDVSIKTLLLKIQLLRTLMIQLDYQLTCF